MQFAAGKSGVVPKRKRGWIALRAIVRLRRTGRLIRLAADKSRTLRGDAGASGRFFHIILYFDLPVKSGA